MERYVSQDPPAATVDLVTAALGVTPVRWVRAYGGIAPTERWALGLPDGTRTFVKLGITDHARGALRLEASFLPALRECRFAPRFGGFADGDVPVLWIEDLSYASWPPPWTADRIERVLQTLRRVRATPPPEGARTAEEFRAMLDGWARIADDPTAFLATGVASEAWLQRALPTLRAASDDARLDGDEMLHMDVRSDNMCFDGERVVLVDWNFTSVGNGDFDVAAWLGSLHAEGGPLPEEILPGAGPEAAFIAGYFACVAGQPAPDGVPLLRPLQHAQLRATLPWAARELGLPPPDLMDGATR